MKYFFFGSETFRIHAFDAGRRRGFTRLSFEEGAVGRICRHLLLVRIHVQLVKKSLCAAMHSLIFDELVHATAKKNQDVSAASVPTCSHCPETAQ